MKNTNKGYNVNFTEKTITITKAFAAKAGTYGTPEFEAFVGLRTAFPDFTVEYKTIERKENKVTYDGLSIEKMIAFIQMKFGEAAAVEFKKYVAVYNGEKGKYPIIKKMFLDKYKKEYNKLTADEKMQLDILANANKNDDSKNITKVELEVAA